MNQTIIQRSILRCLCVYAIINTSIIAASNVVAVDMGPHHFEWIFNQDVESGHFIDGQAWVVWHEGLEITDVTPAGHKADRISDFGRDRWLDGIWINMTVKNPSPMLINQEQNGKWVNKKIAAFGLDSRGLQRTKRELSRELYNHDLSWYPGKPLAETLSVAAGDSIVTAYSFASGETCDRTGIKVAAVLSIVPSTPPANAFRPAPIRSNEQRKNISYYTSDNIIDLSDTSPHLIKMPKHSIYNLPMTPTKAHYADWTAPHLDTLFTGPDIVSCGGLFHDGTHALYNIVSTLDGNVYGADTAVKWGELAIGALASWQTEKQRQQCAHKIVQQAIDAYYAIDAGLAMIQDGGHNPAYAALITIGGGFLGTKGQLFLDVNKGVHGLAPEYSFADYLQIYTISRKTEYKNGIQYIDYRSQKTGANLSTANKSIAHAEDAGTSDGQSFLRLPASYKWKIPRPHRFLIHAKLKITTGPGKSDQIYTICGLENIPKTVGRTKMWGGDLIIRPQWPSDNIPTAESDYTISAFTSNELDRLIFSPQGWEGNTFIELKRMSTMWSSSPTPPYANINAGAYMGNIIAIYALGVEKHYASLFDEWLVEQCTIPGVGEVLLQDMRGHRVTSEGSNTDVTRRDGQFLGALFRQEVLLRKGIQSIAHNKDTPMPSTSDYTAPQGGKLWNEDTDEESKKEGNEKNNTPKKLNK